MDSIIQAVAHRYQIASNVVLRFSAVVDKAKLEQWKKDLRVMTKIYRDIPLDFSWDDESAMEKAKDQFFEAQKLFRVFRDGFTDWVYKVVLPKKDKKDQGYIERELSKSAWDFQYTLSLLFPTMHGNIPDFSKLKHEREKNIKRYQVAATKAFKDLGEYVASQGGALQRHDPVETMDVGGIRVTLENYGRDDDSEVDLYKTLNQLKKWVSGIERAGFPGAVQGLSVTVNFDQRESFTNGKYAPATDTLTLFPLGLAGKGTIRTVTHEIGHRFYFRNLPGQARAHWDEVMNAKGIKITKDDINRFADAVIPKVDPDNPIEMNDEARVLQVALQAARNESDELIFRELAKLPVVSWDAKTFDRSKYLDFLMGSEGETVLVEEITEYGRTNPVEAFAECFQLWVLKGPRALGPWTQEFFKTVCRAGGAKIAKLSPRQRGWERRRELDDFAKNNIPPEYQHAWDKIKSQFKGTPDQRAEQFMEYMEEHPGENDMMLQDRADRDLARMQREQQKQVRLEQNCEKNQTRYEEAWYKEQERATKEKRKLKQLQEKAESACKMCPTCDDVPKRDDYDPVPFAASASLRIVDRYNSQK